MGNGNTNSSETFTIAWMKRTYCQWTKPDDECIFVQSKGR
jgi:hypothetical protein